jgi:hypothetical protein
MLISYSTSRIENATCYTETVSVTVFVPDYNELLVSKLCSGNQELSEYFA